MQIFINKRRENLKSFFNKMTSTECEDLAPKYLTVNYLENILKKCKQDESIRIVNMITKPATAKGENYASIMTRITVEYKTAKYKELQQKYFLLKSQIIEDPEMLKLFSSYAVSQTEMCMYEKVLPALSQLIEQIGDKDQLFAETLHVDYENEAILFQDLVPLNYSIGDRLKGMNLEEAKMALKKLAKMHAAGVVLDQQHPELLRKFIYGIVNEKTQGFAPFFNYSIVEAAKCARNIKELGAMYYNKLMKLQPHVYDIAWRARQPSPNRFNTLIHGDFWLNNIMMRSNNKNVSKIEDVIMIDFQFCCWAPATIDLHYFMNTSLEGGLHEGNEAPLIQYYSEILQETMLKLNYNGHIPTLHELWVQYEDTRFYGFTSAMVNQPLMINPITDDADIHSLIGDNERAHNFRKALYENPVMLNYVKRLLPLFDQRGILNEQYN